MLASAAAHETGLPPNVERWSPGLYAAAISGQSAGDAFGGDQNVWSDAIMFDSEHFPGAPETALDLVGDEEDPVSVENFLDLAEIIRRRNDDAALPKHRFGDKGCNVA